MMSLHSIRNLNLFATLATGYICIMSSQKDDTIFIMELKECSKRIYDIPKFIFYALGYAIGRVLAGTRSGIKRFLLKKREIKTAYIDRMLWNRGIRVIWLIKMGKLKKCTLTL